MNYLVTDTELTSVANAIRAKARVSGQLVFPVGFVNAISGITEKEAETYQPSASDRVIAANQYLAGAQTIKGVTTQNIVGTNIKKGVTMKVGGDSDPVCVMFATGNYTGEERVKEFDAGGGGWMPNPAASFHIPASEVIEAGHSIGNLRVEYENAELNGMIFVGVRTWGSMDNVSGIEVYGLGGVYNDGNKFCLGINLKNTTSHNITIPANTNLVRAVIKYFDPT